MRLWKLSRVIPPDKMKVLRCFPQQLLHSVVPFIRDDAERNLYGLAKTTARAQRFDRSLRAWLLRSKRRQIHPETSRPEEPEAFQRLRQRPTVPSSKRLGH